MSKFKGFSTVQLQSPKKSLFDKTHDKRLSTKMGRLTPVLVEEAIPGDYFRGNTQALVRLAPLLAPIYEQLHVYVHFFFVPNRLLWEDWEEFITGGRLGVGVDPVTAPIPPYYEVEDAMEGSTDYFINSSLNDYLGIPDLVDLNPTVGAWNGVNLDLMPNAAYQLIWMEYYRDRNYIGDDFMEFPLPSGQMTSAGGVLHEMFQLRTRDYLKDYFTSALPFTQRGEEVLMPLAGTGSVTYLPVSETYLSGGGVPTNDSVLRSLDNTTEGLLNFNDGANSPGRVENIDEVLLTASSVSMNDFRSAYALQVWLERNAIGGSRYTESIQAHFDVRPQDSRLQRPEFLGGGRIHINITEVVNTAFSQNGEATVPAGNLNGRAVSFGNTNQFTYFCPEHGFVIGILSIMNPPTYQQGMPRMFYARRSFLGYPWPTFAKLGEQQVDKGELYALPANLIPDADGVFPLFGYQSRYADWKVSQNTNHGQFRDTLLMWSMTRVFDDTPVLGEDFVRFDETTQERVFIVNQNLDNFWFYIHNNLTVVRALPYFGMPNTLGFS